MVVRTLGEREVYAQSREALSRFGLSILGIGLALIVVNLLLLDRSVLAPLGQLSRSLGEIETTSDVHRRVPVRGNDELAGIASDVNGMLAALERAQTDVAAARVDLEHRVELRTCELAEANETLLAEIEDRRRAEAQLAFLASHDYLTGLFGRRRFEEELDVELARAQRSGDHGAVLWLDLDHFKEINDSLGHSVGDEMLRGIASIMRETLRSYSSVARLGGDEFAVVLSGVDAEQAMVVASRLVAEVAQQAFLISGHNLRATVSVGAVLYPDHGLSSQDLLARADLAMYHAKREGRGRACLYDPRAEWHAELTARLSWAERIDEALAEGRFQVWAQPICDVGTGEAVRHELLVRMQSPDGEVVLPSEFLPAAERLGRIHAIDRWMVVQAIRCLGDEFKKGRTLHLDVNLSGRAFADVDLLSTVEEELERNGVDPRLLGLEITETAAIVDIVKAQRFVERLGSLGCRFALDDFGAGFSSFYYLKQLPVDCLKIDGSFVRGLLDSEQDQHLVRAIVELGRGLGITVAAEYVEDAKTLDLLRQYGVDYAQGFFLGCPRPLSEVLADPALGVAAG
jgi:diguanylate cyclase (GGDEF)-like protein